MFDGAMVSVPDMPWSYLPTLFALQLPEVMLGADLVGGIVGDHHRRCRATTVPARRKTILLMLTLAATLPLVIAMVKRPALYNGIRHFIFVHPADGGARRRRAFAGADGLAARQSPRLRKRPSLAVFCFGLMLPLAEMIRLHPYQYTHFNHIAGTVRARRRRCTCWTIGALR